RPHPREQVEEGAAPLTGIPQVLARIPHAAPPSLSMSSYLSTLLSIILDVKRYSWVMEHVAGTPADEVDDLVAAWQAERPDLDVRPMQGLSRVSPLARHPGRERRSAFAAPRPEPWEFDVLAALRRQGAPYELSPGALLRATLVTSGTMTNRIDRLEEAGLVRRRSDPQDKRGVLVTLTAAGHSRVDAALADLLAAEQALLAGLPEDGRHTLAGLLRILLAPLDAGCPPPRPLPVPAHAQPLLLQPGPLRLHLPQLPAKLDQRRVVARPRRQFPGQLLLPHPEPVDLPFQPLQLLFCHTPIPRNPSPGTRPTARGKPYHGSRPPPGTPPLQVLVNPATEKRHPPIPQQGHHMIGPPLQEIPIMTHHDQRPCPPVQQVFQFGQRIHIKIISRLIQQQYIGLPHQDTQQLHPSPLPARQLPGGSKLHVPPQPQAVQQAPDRPRTLPRVHIPPDGRHPLPRRQPLAQPPAPLPDAPGPSPPPPCSGAATRPALPPPPRPAVARPLPPPAAPRGPNKGGVGGPRGRGVLPGAGCPAGRTSSPASAPARTRKNV